LLGGGGKFSSQKGVPGKIKQNVFLELSRQSWIRARFMTAGEGEVGLSVIVYSQGVASLMGHAGSLQGDELFDEAITVTRRQLKKT
jgi:hypothetical protein